MHSCVILVVWTTEARYQRGADCVGSLSRSKSLLAGLLCYKRKPNVRGESTGISQVGYGKVYIRVQGKLVQQESGYMGKGAAVANPTMTFQGINPICPPAPTLDSLSHLFEINAARG